MSSNADPQWRDLSDEDRARAYSPSSVLDGPIDPYIQAYVDQSAAAYRALAPIKTMQYGPEKCQSIDMVAPNTDGLVPLHVFIHGGYWQELSKRESFFPAPDTLRHGVAFAAIDYTLAPNARMDDIVDECRNALTYIHKNASRLGIDQSNIIVSGSSAGAHLAAMACVTLPSEQHPKAVVLLSGVYDLEPLIGTYINDAVGLDRVCTRRNSPLYQNLSGFPQTIIAWGQNETDEFKRQSQTFARALQRANVPVHSFEVKNRNHFDIVMDLGNDSDLGRLVQSLTDDTLS